jgi:hypothetical protein
MQKLGHDVDSINAGRDCHCHRAVGNAGWKAPHEILLEAAALDAVETQATFRLKLPLLPVNSSANRSTRDGLGLVLTCQPPTHKLLSTSARNEMGPPA